MNQWEIWLVKQQYARKELNPPQPNDPSEYDRMYVIVANPRGRDTVICCPVQNATSRVGMTEIALQRGYTTCITKDCKIITHEIFSLPQRFFETKKGFIRPQEQEKIQTSVALVFGL